MYHAFNAHFSVVYVYVNCVMGDQGQYSVEQAAVTPAVKVNGFG